MTAGVAWPRSTASPGCGPARHRPGPASWCVGTPTAVPRRCSAGRARWSSRRCGTSRPSWWWSATGRPARTRRRRRRPRVGRWSCSTPPAATRWSSSTTGPTVIVRRSRHRPGHAGPSPRARGGAGHRCRRAAPGVPRQPPTGAVHGGSSRRRARRRRRAARRGGHRRAARRRAVPPRPRPAGPAGGQRPAYRPSWSNTTVMSIRHGCATAIFGLGSSPRDLLARIAPDLACAGGRLRGDCARTAAAPRRGRHLPLLGYHRRGPGGRVGPGLPGARAGEAGQPVRHRHLPGQRVPARTSARGWRNARAGRPSPFTARPAARQLTLGEAAAGYHVDAFRRTALHGEHHRLGAQLDRFGGWWRPWSYGDLRRGVLGGAASGERRRRLDPREDGRVRAGRGRGAGAAVPEPRPRHPARADPAYVLVLNERGHIIDDGMICRDDDARFTLTFTSGGASAAEMWVRDWIETWGLRVHVLDRTMSLGAINVTGPSAAELLRPPGRRRPAPLPPAPSPAGGRDRLPRDAAVLHRRGQLRAAPSASTPRSSCGRHCCTRAPTSVCDPMAWRPCSGSGWRRAT